MTKYLTNFSSNEDIISQYDAPKDALDGANILVAWYGYGSYDGSSIVIFEQDGKLYEVNGSHCSCYGLEGQWRPEETSWAALAMRKWDSAYTDGESEFNAVITDLIKSHQLQPGA